MLEEGKSRTQHLLKETRGLSTTEYLVLLLAAVVTSMLAWSLFSDSTEESTDEAGVAIRDMEGQAGNLSAHNWTGPATNSSVLGETGNTTFAGQTIGAGPSSHSAPSIELGPATQVNAPTREYQPPTPIVLVADESPEEPVTRTLPPSISLVDEDGNPITLSNSNSPSHYENAAQYHANQTTSSTQTDTSTFPQNPSGTTPTSILEGRGAMPIPLLRL